MSEHKVMIWDDGRIADDEVVGPRPWSFVAGLVVLVLLAELALSLHDRFWPAAADVDVRDVNTLRSQLEAAASDEGQPFLLVGDSVLAGDVMRGRVDDWEHHRVIDAMRAAASPDSGARFHQIALDAMLPIDMLHVVQELDAVDPAARVPVVIELNPRYFSRSYTDVRECTRPYLCEIGPTLLGKGGALRWNALGAWLAALVHWELGAGLPLYRHRGELRSDVLPAAVAALVPPREAEAPDPLSARARLLTHYQGLVLDRRSQQIVALEAIVARLAASGRRAVFFTTPLEDEFAAAAADGAAQGRYTARMASIVAAAKSPRVELVNLDHPLFSSPLFLDHCHLGPEGNRRLAVNLLVELDVALADTPADDELVQVEGADRTLVSRTDQGFSDGAAWQALFRGPTGLAVAPGGRRIVIADTGNHCLRQLTGNLQTVSTLAGAGGADGDVDGKRHLARMLHPSAPVIVGESVYFVDQDGTSLRVVESDAVRTIARAGASGWTRIDAMVHHAGRLLVLDEGKRVLSLDPLTGRGDELVVATGEDGIKAFAVSPEGRLFVADLGDRIWEGHVAAGRTTLAELTLEFPNTATTAVPQVKGLYMPLDYDQLKLADIVGMVWVERYQALLVQDDLPTKKGVKGMTERIQLRLVDPEDEVVYPWLKPLVHGGAYLTYNKKSASFTSYFHLGQMALDQDTATLFWLEEHRSRLFYIGDGAMGVAKIGHIANLEAHGARDLLGSVTGAAILADLRPDRHLHRRLERHRRAGPYLAFMIGSSMLSKSDMIGSYSFGARFERRMRDLLGYRDHARFDVIQRSYAGVRSGKVLQELRNFIDSGAQPDVIMIELTGAKDRFFEGDSSEGRMREILAEVDGLARRTDAMVVFFDNASIGSVAGRDGLRSTPANERRFEKMAREAGFVVVTTGDELLRDALENSPWGSPPWRSHHAAPWAMDATADLLAERLYPTLREHLRDRVPAVLRVVDEEASAIASIADAFEEVEADWPALLPTIGEGQGQSELHGEELEIFVDLARIEVDASDRAALETVALGALYAYGALDPAGTRARSAHVRLARFSRYDEYGAGVRDAAEVVFEGSWDRDQLVVLLQARAGQ